MFECSSIPDKASRTATPALEIALHSSMPGYYHQDCHYFYRTSLRGLSIATLVSPLHS